MECCTYIEGEDLGKRLKREGTIPPDEAVRIVIEAASALEESHEGRVIHRDIKPGNILIDRKGRIYVTDFGIAKTVGSLSLTSPMGTPLYMSPEHHKGKQLDQRSDIYSLGIVLYEMLTGDVPFHADTASAIGIMHISQEPAPPRSRNGQISVWLNSVVMRLLSKEPGRRFQSCGELVSALREKITVPIPRRTMSPASRKWLSGKKGKGYRLPTEAEWEYAARSRGKEYRYSWGNGSPSGNIAGEEVKRQFPKRPWEIWAGYTDDYIYTAEVGKFKANEIGLYDMSGNVWEWCNDVYGGDYYKSSPCDNPQGPPYTGGSGRVDRGGSWGSTAEDLRASDRGGHAPACRHSGLGFRLALWNG